VKKIGAPAKVGSWGICHMSYNRPGLWF